MPRKGFITDICPNCQNPYDLPVELVTVQNKEWYRIRCKCGLSGPWRESPEEAIYVWNVMCQMSKKDQKSTDTPSN